MFKLISEEHLPVTMAFLKKDPDLNLFFIGDIEQFGLQNDFMQVWLDDLKTPHSALLRYRKNLLLYSDDLSFSPKEILGYIQRYDVDCFSCGEKVFEKMQSVFDPACLIKDCDMAKMTKIQAFQDSSLVRIATPEDARAIVESLCSIREFADYRLIDPDAETPIYQKRLQNRENFHFIIKENNRVVANANTSAMSSVSAMIGGVFTLPECRNKGYATAVVGRLCSFLLEHKITPILFFENPKAASIYHRLGFKDFGKWFMYFPKSKKA